MANLEGKVGLVTGGATGIGLGCAQAIVDGGGKVMICARRREVLEAAAKQLGDNAAWVVADVCDDASMDASVAATVERFGKLDLAVNSAGTGAAGPILDLTTEQFEAAIQTNLTGVFRSMRAQGRAMREAGGGSIVNISSIAGTQTHRWMSPYCASKAAVNMLSMCAADELGEYDIRVNVVQPGVVRTPMAAMLTDNDISLQEYLRLMPISRVGKPEDVGNLVAFLLSDDASWITGQVIGVNGGQSVRKGPDLVPLFKSFTDG